MSLQYLQQRITPPLISNNVSAVVTVAPLAWGECVNSRIDP